MYIARYIPVMIILQECKQTAMDGTKCGPTGTLFYNLHTAISSNMMIYRAGRNTRF